MVPAGWTDFLELRPTVILSIKVGVGSSPGASEVADASSSSCTVSRRMFSQGSSERGSAGREPVAQSSYCLISFTLLPFPSASASGMSGTQILALARELSSSSEEKRSPLRNRTWA